MRAYRRSVRAFRRHRRRIHFAAFKAVGESVAELLRYYENKLGSLASLARLMGELGAKHVVFSSSATVYGDPERVPIPESGRLAPTNPYGWTKLLGEQLLRDLAASDPSWQVTLLRYFNPVGAHASGLIGEDPGGIPNNLMPFVSQVAVGRLPKVSVFGDDYPTRDGTGVRDYLHRRGPRPRSRPRSSAPAANGLLTVNLGTGRGYSVLEVVKAFEKASGRAIAYRIVDRRPGDVAEVYADASLAARELGWTAERGIDEMCRDTWNWQRRNPEGYGEGDRLERDPRP
jgi:UDP-glucose 4-epimerase